MPDQQVANHATATGRLLGDWAIDPNTGGPLAGHAHAKVAAAAGSGKTLQVTNAADRAVANSGRVICTAFTNAQVVTLVERLAACGLDVVHYAAKAEVLDAPPPGVTSTSDVADCSRASLVAATSYKAGEARAKYPGVIGTFDVGFVDEAYQVRSDRKALWAMGLAPRWAFIGDPGQIPVFTTLPTSPFMGRDDPVSSIVDSAEADGADMGHLDFGWTWRLPAHGAPVLAHFYDMPVAGVILDADREVVFGPARLRRGVGRYAAATLDRAARHGWGFLELPGEALDPADMDAADALAAVVADATARRGRVRCERDGWQDLTPANIGVAVATQAQVTLVTAALARLGIAGVPVATYNGHQGLEYPLMVMWHPVSGISDADAFYLEMGRLCVGVSRHRHAAVVVGRSSVRRVLADPPVSPEAPWPGRPDRILGGWRAHVALLDHIDNLGATVTW